MAYRLPPLTWLRAFEASARLLSFTEAAKELNLSQASISQRVRQLERRLGTSLFERMPRSLRLTDMGKAYLPAVRDSFESLSASTDSLFGSLKGGTVTVRAPISFATLWLAPRLNRFFQQHDNVQVELTTEVWADTTLAQRLDIAIRFGDGNWQGCETELIHNEGVIPVCSPTFRKENPQPLHELSADKLIHILWGEDLWWRYLDSEAGESDIHPKRINVDTSLAALELARNDGGFALILRQFAQPALDSGLLVIAEDRELPVSRSHYIVHAEGNEHPRGAVLAFREWLLKELSTTTIQ